MEKEVYDWECELFRHAKAHSWKWITGSELLSIRPCILIFMALTAAAAVADVTAYDGHNTNGEIILTMETSANQTRQVNFIEHIYCKRGLYVAIGTAVTGVLVVWHDEPQGKGP